MDIKSVTKELCFRQIAQSSQHCLINVRNTKIFNVKQDQRSSDTEVFIWALRNPFETMEFLCASGLCFDGE